MEGREVPAINTWLGYNTSFTDAQNWSDGLPTSDDQLYFDGNAGSVPGVPGSPPPPPIPGVNPHQSTTFVEGTVGLHTFPTSYAGVHLVNGYAGTITIPFDITFGDYEQTTGYTSNSYAGSGRDMTVTGSFNWTGGNINTSAYAGVLHIKGVQNGVIGNDTSNISSGSKINIETNGSGLGANVTARGILNLVNLVGIEVFANTLFQIQGGAGGAKQKTNMQPGAQFLTKGETRVSGGDTKGAYVVDGGVLYVTPTGDLHGLNVDGQVDPNVTGSPSVLVLSGVLGIVNGESLSVSTNVEVKGTGQLKTYTNPNPAALAQVATIDGDLYVRNGTVSLGNANAGLEAVYSDLNVTGDARLLGGSWACRFDSGDADKLDRITSDGNMMFSAAFTVTPTPTAGDRGQRKWTIFVAQGGFVDSTDANVPMGWTLTRKADGKGIDLA